jgi:class 3 adenylate cyclase
VGYYLCRVSSVLIGTRVGSFRIERLLGRGGSGDVYLAYDVELGRRVALKLLPEAQVGDSALRERFTRETQILATVEHPNVIPMYAAGEIDDRSYIAMRYIPEGSLRTRLRAGALELNDAVRVVGQVAKALDAAHAQNFVHRDVKPENILVDANGTAYLVDFFVAAAAPEPGRVFGTPPYMAPEQWRAQEVDWRSDLYALACVLYECLTGHPPFGDEGRQTTLERQVRSPVPRLSETVPTLPRALDAVFEKALAKEPGARYPSGAALLEAVGDALNRGGLQMPRGTLTFMFTDIEGSTQLLRRLRDRYPGLISDHQRIVRAAFARHRGQEVDTQGESFFAIFATATEAVLAALDTQRSLAAHTWPDGAEVRIRIGVHTGQASAAGERVFGLAVHRAARIAAAGGGGQTLISETTRALLDDEERELPRTSLRDLGPQELKDFERPIRLYEVVSVD